MEAEQLRTLLHDTADEINRMRGITTDADSLTHQVNRVLAPAAFLLWKCLKTGNYGPDWIPYNGCPIKAPGPRQGLWLWLNFLLPFLKSKIGSSIALDAGRYDRPVILHDDKQRVIGRDGQPLELVEDEGGSRLVGEPATNLDNLTNAQLLDVLRMRYGDWADMLRRTARSLPQRQAASTKQQQKPKWMQVRDALERMVNAGLVKTSERDLIGLLAKTDPKLSCHNKTLKNAIKNSKTLQEWWNKQEPDKSRTDGRNVQSLTDITLENLAAPPDESADEAEPDLPDAEVERAMREIIEAAEQQGEKDKVAELRAADPDKRQRLAKLLRDPNREWQWGEDPISGPIDNPETASRKKNRIVGRKI